MTQYLTAEQVHQLNEKHGWFQYRDAQSDGSKAFAQDAIEMHERMRAAAPELLAALEAALFVIQDYLEYDHDGDPWKEDARTMGEMDINDYERDGRLEFARAAIAKATGAAS